MPMSQQRRDELDGWIQAGDAKRWREAAGWTIDRAARKLRVGQSTLKRWEAANAQGPSGRRAEDYRRFLDRIRPKEDNE